MKHISNSFPNQNIILCMNFIGKSNKDDDYYMKKKGYRNPLKNKINNQYKHNLLVDYINPFSQQLTPWNDSSKLETSMNLLKQQNESRILSKNTPSKNAESSVQQIVSQDSLDFSGLAIQDEKQKQKQLNNRFACPKLKINSQQIIVSKHKKDQAKRLLFHKKSLIENKKTKKMASLTIQWDEDIIYNPEKKYFDEQNLKRKILKQFSQTKNQSRDQISKKELKAEDKTFKLEFKNNRIHRKEVTIFEFKKHQNSLSPAKDNNRYEKGDQFSNLYSTLDNKGLRQKQNQVRVSNLSFEPIHSISECPDVQTQNKYERIKSYNSEKWKFRSSLKAKRNVSPEKGSVKNHLKFQFNDKNKFSKQEISRDTENEYLNKITLQLNQKVKDHCVPFPTMARTSPNFFKKTVD